MCIDVQIHGLNNIIGLYNVQLIMYSHHPPAQREASAALCVVLYDIGTHTHTHTHTHTVITAGSSMGVII